MKKVRVILVDDHDFYRKTLRMIINSFEDCEVIGEASNGLEFLELFRNKIVDVVFMDIKMPRMNGIKATQIAVSENHFTKIIALTMFEEKEYFMRMIEVGAKGFIIKDSDESEIKNAINTVIEGDNYYPKRVIDNLFINS